MTSATWRTVAVVTAMGAMLLGGYAGAVAAATVQGTFTGAVALGQSDPPVYDITGVWSAAVPIGTPVSGTFSYDTSMMPAGGSSFYGFPGSPIGSSGAGGVPGWLSMSLAVTGLGSVTTGGTVGPQLDDYNPGSYEYFFLRDYYGGYENGCTGSTCRDQGAFVAIYFANTDLPFVISGTPPPLGFNWTPGPSDPGAFDYGFGTRQEWDYTCDATWHNCTYDTYRYLYFALSGVSATTDTGSVPAPATLVLLGTALAGLGAVAPRGRRAA